MCVCMHVCVVACTCVLACMCVPACKHIGTCTMWCPILCHSLFFLLTCDARLKNPLRQIIVVAIITVVHRSTRVEQKIYYFQMLHVIMCIFCLIIYYHWPLK